MLDYNPLSPDGQGEAPILSAISYRKNLIANPIEPPLIQTSNSYFPKENFLELLQKY
jgi:hypothetical protein